MPDVCADQADTYKCYARNEFGKAVVTVTLNVIEGQMLSIFSQRQKIIIRLKFS